MTQAELRSALLALPVDERAALARELIASLDAPPEAGIDEAWTAEVVRRAQQVEEGTAVLTDWGIVRDRVAAELRRRRASSSPR